MRIIIYLIIFLIVIILLIGVYFIKIMLSDEGTVPTVVLTPDPLNSSDDDVTIFWIGHAGFYINFYGLKIVIDPALSERIGINIFGDINIGPKRKQHVPIKAEDLGEIDLLIISHVHTDHFDYPTIKKLQSKNTTVITPKNTTRFWKTMTYKDIIEMHWKEKMVVDGLQIQAIEGKHWGARIPWQRNLNANSYLISKNGVNIFFGGDTGYNLKFARQLKNISIDVAIMGIGAYSPKPFENSHATPEQAWKMANEINAKAVIPMHWGTFKLSQEPMDEPMKRFMKAVGDEKDKIVIDKIGGTWVIPKK